MEYSESNGRVWRYGEGVSLEEAQDIFGRKLPDIEVDPISGYVPVRPGIARRIDTRKRLMLAKYYISACGERSSMYVMITDINDEGADKDIGILQFHAAIAYAIEAGHTVWLYDSPHGKIVDINPHRNFRPRPGEIRLTKETFKMHRL